jgi:diguanylate cyclase (GGDEF)-like protein
MGDPMAKARARFGSWWDPIRYAIQIAGMGLAGYALAIAADEALGLDGAAAWAVGAAIVFVVLGGLELLIVGRPLQRSIELGVQKSAAREGRLRAEASRQEFEGRLHRALDMAQDEHAALDMVDRALLLAAPDRPAELLLADSSRARLVRSAGAGHDRACGVESPRDCVAVRRGQTLTFPDSDELDACPHLRGRGVACSAVCVPVNVLGNTVGVLHTVGEVRTPPSQDVAIRLETISTQAGARIGMLRALQRSEIQAATDPLTGLLNRRSVEDRLYALMREERAFAVAICDHDNIKQLNDTHGHEAGDRALRLFASTVKASLRPHDHAARYGGEEFLLVFPDCGADAAIGAVERLREELALAVNQGGTPVFTASFGVADLRHGTTIDEIMKHADDALLLAKREGKNRVLAAAAAA